MPRAPTILQFNKKPLTNYVKCSIISLSFKNRYIPILQPTTLLRAPCGAEGGHYVRFFKEKTIQ